MKNAGKAAGYGFFTGALAVTAIGADVGAKGGIVAGPVGVAAGAVAGATIGFLGAVAGNLLSRAIQDSPTECTPTEYKLPSADVGLTFKNGRRQSTSSAQVKGERSDDSRSHQGNGAGNASDQQPPKRNEEIPDEDQKYESLEQLLAAFKVFLQNLQRILNSGQPLSAQQQQQCYSQLIRFMENLVDRGATLQFSGSGTIVLEVEDNTITIDGGIRNLFNYSTIISALDESVNDVIYGIWCTSCQRYVYVGQSVNLNQRSISHHSTMRRVPGSCLGQHGRSHSLGVGDDFDQIFRMDVLRRVLLGRTETGRLQGRQQEIVRFWEVFFQWFLQTRADEGGCNHR